MSEDLYDVYREFLEEKFELIRAKGSYYIKYSDTGSVFQLDPSGVGGDNILVLYGRFINAGSKNKEIIKDKYGKL